jgi:hypothetical protein
MNIKSLLLLIIFHFSGSLMYAQNFPKILYGMKSLMIIYTSKQRGYSQQTERANGIVCCKRFHII